MSKRNQKDTKKVKSLHYYFNKNNQTEDKNIEQTIPKNQNRKRLCPIFNMISKNQQKSPSSAVLSKKYCIFQVAKQIQVDQFLEKCPKLTQLLRFLKNNVKISENILANIIKKCINHSSNSLWNSKYSPSQSSQLFNIKAGFKIKDWLNAFFEYRNKICQESDSFLDDFQQKQECKIRKIIHQNSWQLLALVVRGRPGIGKSSAIRAIAHEMNIDLQQCGNHFNQTKYLKQKNESTQSESVKTAISRKTKLQKNAQMITKFMTPVQRQIIVQNKKTQMIHNVGQIFPQTEANKFYTQLSRCIQFSKIPFIMTDSCDKIPKQCQKYDIIDFEQGSNQKIYQFFWSIYHIENILKLNTLLQIQKQQIFNEINKQIQNIQIQQLTNIQKINQICIYFNYRLDSIFTFLHHHKQLSILSINNLFLQKYKNYTKQKFLNQIFLLKPKKQIKQQGKISIQKSQISIQHTQDSQQNFRQNQIYQFHQYFRKLKIIQVQDLLPQQSHNTIYQQQWQSNLKSCININIHKEIKKQLSHTINEQINLGNQKFKSTLKKQQFQYISMIIKEKRSSRNNSNNNNKINDNNLQKYFNQQQCQYIKQFGNLIKNQ